MDELIHLQQNTIQQCKELLLRAATWMDLTDVITGKKPDTQKMYSICFVYAKFNYRANACVVIEVEIVATSGGRAVAGRRMRKSRVLAVFCIFIGE